MSYSLPPLNPLKAFEAVARCGSLTAAAQELEVSPGAIGRQLRVLENYFGVNLLKRGLGAVELTREGAQLFQMTSGAFSAFQTAFDRVERLRQGGQVTILASPVCARFWVIPNLVRFRRQHPDVAFKLNSPPFSILETHVQEGDLAFMVGTGDWPSLTCHKISDFSMIPVCVAGLAGDLLPLSDLGRATLLVAQSQRGDWDRWSEISGIDHRPAPRMELSSLAQAYEACLSGMGVALLARELVQPRLDSGELVAASDTALRSDLGLFLTYRHQRPLGDCTVLLRDWMIADAMTPPAEAGLWLHNEDQPI